MRQAFSEFYGPTNDEYKRLLTDGLIVLDTNVLLQAYELPKEGREALLDTLEKLQGRLWIPFHVGLEFQLRRLSVIARQLGKIDGILVRGQDAFQKLRAEVEGLELQKRGVTLDDAALKAALATAETELRKIVSETKDGAAEVSLSDPIRDRIDALFEGRVGDPPVDQAAVDMLGKVAQERYEREIPPGFKDSNKDKDDSEAGVIYARGLRYERRYGDYYLWSQTLSYVKEARRTVVLFVTSDLKRDWWQEVRKTTVGPLPALVREMKSEGGVDLFWMYSLRQFLDQANIHLDARVSEAALQEVEASEEAARKEPAQNLAWRNFYNFFSSKLDDSLAANRRALMTHYSQRGYETAFGPNSDGVLIKSGDYTASVKIVNWPMPLFDLENSNITDLEQVVSDSAEMMPRVGALHLVVLVPDGSAEPISRLGKYTVVLFRLMELAKRCALSEVSVGVVNDGVFRMLVQHQSDHHP